MAITTLILSAGIAAAIQSSGMGKSVVLIEPTNRIGGLTRGAACHKHGACVHRIGTIDGHRREHVHRSKLFGATVAVSSTLTKIIGGWATILKNPTVILIGIKNNTS